MAEAMLANQPIKASGEMISETTKTKDNCFFLPSSHHHHHNQQMGPPSNATDTLKQQMGPPSNATDTLKQQQQQHHPQKRNDYQQHHPIIGIIPSNKRQKLAKPTIELIRNAVEGINKSISKSDRLSAIGAACATFDHDYSSTHDDEVRTFNADSALLKHLTLLLYKKSRIEENNAPQSNNNNTDDDDDDISTLKEEVGYTLSALEMVCRCNATTLSESFNKFGYDLLDVLVFILKDFYRKDHEEQERPIEYERRDSVVSWDLVGTEHHANQSNSALNKLQQPIQYHSYSGDFAVNKATKILCHIARVGSAIEPLAKHHGTTDPDKSIIQILKTIIDTVRKDDGSNYQEARLNTLWIIANLACAPENMVYMASYSGLLDTLLKVVVRCGRCNTSSSSNNNNSGSTTGLLDDDDIDDDALAESFGYSNNNTNGSRYRTRCVAARGQAVRAFLNLSWAEENKLIFSNMKHLLTSLIDIIITSSDPPKSSTALSVLKSTKRHAAGTLRNIAAVQNTNQKLYLCTFDNNILLQSLLDALSNKEQNAIDDSVRERIFATFYNLCCDETIQIFKSYPNLLQIFQDAASATNTQQVHQDGIGSTTASDIRELAERTLKFIHDNNNNDNVVVVNNNNNNTHTIVIDHNDHSDGARVNDNNTNVDQQQAMNDESQQQAVINNNTDNTTPNNTAPVTTNMQPSSSLDQIHIDAV